MNANPFRLLATAVVVMLVCCVPAFANPALENQGAAYLGAGIGAAFTIIGAGFGFGKIGAAAMEGIARQPEAARDVGQNMLIIAALLEGATFFSLIICILLVVLK
jgi:F-type H+-transporting ATPase subunit c